MGRFVIAVFRRAGECLHESATRGHEFGGARPHLPLQLHRIVRQVVVVRLDHQGIADPQHQFTRIHRFGQEVGRAEFEGFLLDTRVADGRQDDDGNAVDLAIGTDLLQNLDAAHLRHHDVQQYDVRLLSTESVHRPCGVGRGDEA